MSKVFGRGVFTVLGFGWLRRALRHAWLLALALVTLVSRDVGAFKVTTHAATANDALDQLGQFITTDPNVPDTLVFRVKGKTLNVPVSAKDAYLAIIAHDDFFRAGVVGPDAFPDLITGQYWQHGNQNVDAQALVRSATGGQVSPTNHPTPDFSSTRVGSSEFRSIDFAMALLAYAKSGDYAFQDTVEQDQVLAFVMGYFAHGVGDSFAHTWVNELAGGAWEFGSGFGVAGPFTEELKHVAIEGLVDSRVPGYLQNADGSLRGEYDRMLIRAPIRFLDAFFSMEIPGHQPHGNKGSSDYEEFLKYYTHIDRFHGSAIYNYWNLQVEAAKALKNFSGMAPLVDFAEDWQPGPFVNTLIDIVDFPEQVINEVESWIGGDFIPFVTGGFLSCELTMGGTSGLDNLRDAWVYLGTFDQRIARYEERAKIARLNWLRLSECTAQNMIRIDGALWDPEHPELNRDACSELADRPWQDEAGSNPDAPGLFRGSLRPEEGDDSQEFLDDLKSYFRGSDDDGDDLLSEEEFIEPKNGHRRIGSNVKRMKSYLMGFGFTLDDLEDVIFTDSTEQSVTRTCNLVQSPAEHRCLNYNLAPIALPTRTAICLAEEAVCVAGKAADCLSGICLTAACAALPPELCLDIPFGIGEVCVDLFGDTCIDLCEMTGQACHAAVNSTCNAFRFCDPFDILGCFDGLADGCKGILRPVCDFIAGGDPNCVPGLFNCVAEGIDCNVNVLTETIVGEGWAEQILSPFIELCDAYDQAKALFERFDTVQERIAFAESHGVPVTRINELVSIYDRIGDKFAGYPPEYFVNVMFLPEDLQQDPEYLADYLDALEQFEEQNSALAPGSEKEARDGAAEKLRSWADAVQGLGEGIPLSNPNLDPALDAAKRDLLEFEQIVGSLVIPTVAGPTAQRILGDVGSDMPTTFNPFFNAVQGIKLIPISDQTDVDNLFDQEGLQAAKAFLPWGTQGVGKFSPNCTDPNLTNLYCDVLISFDDPNCFGAEGEGCADSEPDPNRNNWINGRGLVAWNKYSPTNPAASNVLTAFPLASSQAAYDSLYVRVFDVPGRLPGFMGFEDEDKPWTTTGPASIEENDGGASEGQRSLQVTGCGYTPIHSPLFNTAELGVVGTKLAIDVLLPMQQGNPHWFGDVQAYVHIPAANVYNAPLGTKALTGLTKGSWRTIEFDIPSNVRSALLGDYPDAQLRLAVNLGECVAPFRIDNVRFTGDIEYRSVFHVPAPIISTNSLFGFENRSDWSSTQNATLAAESTNKIQGSSALAVVNASGYGVFTSRSFGSAEVGPVTSKLALSIFIPRPQPNQHWTGDVSLAMTCPSKNIHNQPLGQNSLTNRFQNEYNRLEFAVPAQLASQLGSTFSGCQLHVALNVGGGAGTFVFDNMAFVP